MVLRPFLLPRKFSGQWAILRSGFWGPRAHSPPRLVRGKHCVHCRPCCLPELTPMHTHSLTHTQAHTVTYTLAHLYIPRYIHCMHTHVPAHTCTDVLVCADVSIHTYTDSRIQTHVYTHTDGYSCTHTYRHWYTRALKYVHTH